MKNIAVSENAADVQRQTALLQSAHSHLSQVCNTFSDSLVTSAMSEVEETLAISGEIETEILSIYNFLRQSYGRQFPELESIVQHPFDYARVVKTIGSRTDLTLVDFQGVLPSHNVMVVSIAASTTCGNPLPQEELQKTIDACDRVLALDDAKQKLVGFVESRMSFTAPNLSAVVGSAVAGKLVGAAGGLCALAVMPACNVQLIGFKKKDLEGFSRAKSQLYVGYVEETEIVRMTPPELALKACQLVAEKSSLAARVDFHRGHPTGEYGRNLKQQILEKIAKWQEPPPAKRVKPLPVPDLNPKKKRGGRRLRKQKERYAMTDMRKLANRMQFGVPEESSLGDGLGVGYGMLSQAGNGKLRISDSQSKLAAKVAKKYAKW